MSPGELILVSVDDHVVEPPDVFNRHLAAQWRDRAPKMVKNRERCTVEALRARAANVDVRPVSGQGGIPPSRSNEPVTMADAFNQLAAALEG